MRPRKRPDWPIRVYKYSVRPEYRTWERLPAGARQEIEEVRALWNSMVEVFGRRQTRYREIVSQPDRDAVGQQVPATRYAVDQLHRAFVAEVQHLAADAPVMRGHRQVVLFQFLATVTRFLRNKGGVPKPKHGVPTEVHFHQRFDGGIPVERIFGRSQRFHLERVPSAALDPLLPFRQQKRLARIGGTLQVRDSVLPFQTMLHRQLPTGAYLKQASLIGRQIVRAGYHLHNDGDGHSLPSLWRWSLHLTVEHPPYPQPTRDKDVRGGTLILHQRLWGEGQLQIGVLVDTNGREEAFVLPEDILAAWRYKRHLQSQADQEREKIKTLLRDARCAVQGPEAVQRLLARIGTVSTAGLWRLLLMLEDASTSGEVATLVRRWADRTTRLRREARGLERRYLDHRNWFYRNLALELCQRYERLEVIYERLASAAAPDKEPVLPELPSNGTHRHLVAPLVFLTFLQQAAAKTGTQVTLS